MSIVETLCEENSTKTDSSGRFTEEDEKLDNAYDDDVKNGRIICVQNLLL